MINNNNKYMKRCLQLALNGAGNVAPNPMVGCVIVNNNIIIGEGFHRKYGEAHAEVNAINSVKDKSLLKEATAYVNLEPCSHFGKTPPCADLLIQHQLKEVVIANVDINPLVANKGIDKLKEAGINVVTGVLEKEAYDLNRRFFTFHKHKRPYIILKWAQTLDGFMDIERAYAGDNKKYWITNDELRILVHKWRSEEASIMIGTNTALNDNPQLNVRLWEGNNPLRIVLDENLDLPHRLHVFDNSVLTIIFNSKLEERKGNTMFKKINFKENIIKLILDYLYSINIQSVIVEGGRELLQSYIDLGLWDEARILTGNKTFNKGLSAPVIKGNIISSETINKDTVTIMSNF
ncbi:MAG: bifunctional diaminohydroxyphosphoribosylaminopyrimidine deaminase/5-amino-6-(5-phosphoribosylamino)uracil reductase RibD [Bacteroidota bacterium]